MANNRQKVLSNSRGKIKARGIIMIKDKIKQHRGFIAIIIIIIILCLAIHAVANAPGDEFIGPQEERVQYLKPQDNFTILYERSGHNLIRVHDRELDEYVYLYSICTQGERKCELWESCGLTK